MAANLSERTADLLSGPAIEAEAIWAHSPPKREMSESPWNACAPLGLAVRRLHPRPTAGSRWAKITAPALRADSSEKRVLP